MEHYGCSQESCRVTHTVLPLALCNDSLDSLLFRRIRLVQWALCVKIDLFINVASYSLKNMMLSPGNNL